MHTECRKPSCRSTELNAAVDDHWSLMSIVRYRWVPGRLTRLPSHVITAPPTQVTNRLGHIFRYTYSPHQDFLRILFNRLSLRRSRHPSHRLVHFIPHCCADDAWGVSVAGYAVGGDFEGEGLSESADSPFRGGVVGKEGKGAVGYNAGGF